MSAGANIVIGLTLVGVGYVFGRAGRDEPRTLDRATSQQQSLEILRDQLAEIGVDQDGWARRARVRPILLDNALDGTEPVDDRTYTRLKTAAFTALDPEYVPPTRRRRRRDENE